jgi:hypothetical protein
MIKPGNENKEINGDYSVMEPVLINGDLTVNGNLEMGFIDTGKINLIVIGNLKVKGDYLIDGASLIVLGDINIDGSIIEESEWSLTVCCGKLNAGKFIESSGELFVLDKLTSPFIFAVYNHGKAVFNDGFNSLFLMEYAHPDSFCFGECDSSYNRLID